MENIRASAASQFQKRLSDRLSDLLNGTQIDPQRLAQETAILADRSDIGEELARLKIHSTQFGGLLEGGGEIGKETGFSAPGNEPGNQYDPLENQRGGRNRLAHHGAGAGAKSAIEKIREQSLNLE